MVLDRFAFWFPLSQGASKDTAEFLSRVTHGDSLRDDENENGIIQLMIGENLYKHQMPGIELWSQDISQRFCRKGLSQELIRNKVWRNGWSIQFLLWQEHLFWYLKIAAIDSRVKPFSAVQLLHNFVHRWCVLDRRQSIGASPILMVGLRRGHCFLDKKFRYLSEHVSFEEMPE